jgi:hypothetical protein
VSGFFLFEILARRKTIWPPPRYIYVIIWRGLGRCSHLSVARAVVSDSIADTKRDFGYRQTLLIDASGVPFKFW